MYDHVWLATSTPWTSRIRCLYWRLFGYFHNTLSSNSPLLDKKDNI